MGPNLLTSRARTGSFWRCARPLRKFCIEGGEKLFGAIELAFQRPGRKIEFETDLVAGELLVIPKVEEPAIFGREEVETGVDFGPKLVQSDFFLGGYGGIDDLVKLVN